MPALTTNGSQPDKHCKKRNKPYLTPQQFDLLVPSGTWASQRSPLERSRNTEFTDTKKQLINGASHLDTWT
jgi:hypothetical protein